MQGQYFLCETSLTQNGMSLFVHICNMEAQMKRNIFKAQRIWLDQYFDILDQYFHILFINFSLHPKQFWFKDNFWNPYLNFLYQNQILRMKWTNCTIENAARIYSLLSDLNVCLKWGRQFGSALLSNLSMVNWTEEPRVLINCWKQQRHKKGRRMASEGFNLKRRHYWTTYFPLVEV